MLGRLHDDEASTAAVGFAIAASLIMLTLVVAQVMVAEPPGVDGRYATHAMAATTALEVLLSGEGASASGNPWEQDADNILRFGLAKDDQRNFLDYEKIRALRKGTQTASPVNGFPDYPEVRSALGITDGDFHLRTYPILPSTDDPRWVKDPRGRVGYVGHVGSAQGYAALTTTTSTASTTLTASLAVQNTGPDAHIFVANIGIGNLASGTVIKTEQRHTRLLSPGESQTLTVQFPRMNYDPAVTGIQAQLTDAYGGVVVQPYWVAATPPSGGSTVSWAPMLSAGKTYYVTGDTVNFLLDHYTGEGERMNNAQSGRFVLVGPNGYEWVNTTTDITLPKNKDLTWSCSNCSIMTGTYTATLWDTGVTRMARDVVHVSAAKLFQQTESLDAIALREISILSSLVENFNGRTNTDADTEGDVFTDASHIRQLDALVSRYTTLVVGSEVRQNSLNAGDTKKAVAAWVEAGGNLVVLGTLDSQSHWLEPIYHAAQQTASGGISAPDPTHAILVSPNRIAYDHYLDRGRAWSIKDDQPFTHVLNRGTTGNSAQDTLTVSNPGAYNSGTVVLTSYMVGSLTSPQDDAEAKRFLHNLLSQSYTMLFLDYGPPIPDGVPVGSSSRLVAVEHPNVPGAIVECRLVMYVFG
jgi:hypothetical protein